MSFLQAEWRKLALVNYEIDPSVLKEYVPAGTELDLWQGKCYVSLVGFMFLNVKLLGIRVPYHVNFEEVNLRFYVKRHVGGEWRRGVVFVKELVPKRALTFIANTVYKEHYETVPMQHEWKYSEENLEITYGWEKGGKTQSLQIKAKPIAVDILAGSEAEFITEHYWGYAKVSETKTNEYEVTHPKWKQYPVVDVQLNVDFRITYGERFNLLNKMQPVSVHLAEGSLITVESKRVIRIT